MLNLFAFRATSPKVMFNAENSIVMKMIVIFMNTQKNVIKLFVLGAMMEAIKIEANKYYQKLKIYII